jgi:hypothetical protein
MPILETKGSNSAQGFGQTTPRPVVYTGTPAENVRNHGLVRLTGNSNNTINLPGMALTTNGYAMFLVKVASLVTGTGVYTVNASGSGYQIVSSLFGTGNYLPVGGGVVANATSLITQTNTAITLGTFFSGTTAGTDTIYLYWVFQNSQHFSCVQYTGNATARTVSFVAASNNCNPYFLMVANSTAGNMYLGFPNSSTGHGWSFASNASAPTNVANRWQGPSAGGVNIGSAGTANTQNVSGNVYYAFCWDGGLSSTTLYGGLPQIVGSAGSTFGMATSTGKVVRFSTNTSPAVNGPMGTWALLVSNVVGTSTPWDCNAASDFLGGVAPYSNFFGWSIPPSGNIVNTSGGGFGSTFGFGEGGGVYSVNATGTGSHGGAVWYTPVSDYYNGVTTARPYKSGGTSALIASGVTTSQYSIGNTDKYPFYFTFLLVVSGAGTGAIAARFYSRHIGFARIQSGATNPNYWYGFNATAGATQADVGYDGNTFGLAGLVSTQSHAIFYAIEYPRIHSMTMWQGSGAAGKLIRHQLNEIPTYMWIKSVNTATTNWYLYHNVLGNTQYINISGNNAAVTDTTFFNNTAFTSTTITLGTNANVNSASDGYMAYMWCSKAGSVLVGYYPGASASQTITTGFTVTTIIITDGSGTDGTVMFTSTLGMTAGANYRMRLSGAVNNATLGDVCLQATLGFTMASSTILNTAGRNYYYIAFA